MITLSKRKTYLWIAFIALALVSTLIAAECAWLGKRQQMRATASANERVREKMRLARLELGAHNWNDALRFLGEAKAEDDTTLREDVEPLIEEAERGQAESILQAAHAAIARKDTARAFHLLDTYLDHPHAAHAEQARSSRADLERALSNREAAQSLSRLSDAELEALQTTGRAHADAGFPSAETWGIFEDTVRRELPGELRRREERRRVALLERQAQAAERVRRIARLRETAAYQTLSHFVAETLAQARGQQDQNRQQEDEWRVLFQQLNVNDSAEREQIRDTLAGRNERGDARRLVERKRAEIKRAYRASADHPPADRDLFEQIVDNELNDLLKMLPPA